MTELFFLFCFLPLSVLFSFFDKSQEYKNFILIIFSVIFFSWGRPFIVCLLFASIVIDWLLGLVCGSEKPKAMKTAALFADLLMNAALFVWLSRNYLFDGIDKLSLQAELIPVGTAFYTLRGFSYVFDVYSKRNAAEKNIFCLMTYMVSFPLMTVSPIVRYGDISEQIRKRSITGNMISDGMSRIVTGLAKLAVAAPALSAVMTAGLDPDEITVFGSWVGMLAYICRFCISWSGLTDISIGCGRLLGFEYPETFRAFDIKGLVSGIAKSFGSTLNGFFSDILVTPAKRKNKLLGGVAVIICGALVGLWYTSNRFFALAGITAAMLIVLEELFLRRFFDSHARIFSYLYTSIAAFVIFSLTRFDDLSSLKSWFMGLFGGGESYIWGVGLKDAFKNYAYVLAVTAIIYFPPARALISSVIKKLSEKSARWYGAFQLLRTAALCILLILSAVAIASSSLSAAVTL